MARIKKLSFRYVSINVLPNSYKFIAEQYLRNKTDDMPLVYFYAGYRFTLWTADLPIEISNY